MTCQQADDCNDGDSDDGGVDGGVGIDGNGDLPTGREQSTSAATVDTVHVCPIQ